MPNLSEVLERARKHVAGGWHEPMSTTSSGTICSASDEGIANYCVSDALEAAAGGDFGLHLEGELAIGKQLQLSGERRSLQTWLEDEKRLHGDVLALFSRAIAHARAEESR
jgi:hypothetical protein